MTSHTLPVFELKRVDEFSVNRLYEGTSARSVFAAKMEKKMCDPELEQWCLVKIEVTKPAAYISTRV